MNNEDQLTAFLERFNFFDMSYRHWMGEEDSGTIEASPWNPIIENFGAEFRTEQNLMLVADYFLDAMRTQYPNKILVCHL